MSRRLGFGADGLLGPVGPTRENLLESNACGQAMMNLPIRLSRDGSPNGLPPRNRDQGYRERHTRSAAAAAAWIFPFKNTVCGCCDTQDRTPMTSMVLFRTILS